MIFMCNVTTHITTLLYNSFSDNIQFASQLQWQYPICQLVNLVVKKMDIPGRIVSWFRVYARRIILLAEQKSIKQLLLYSWTFKMCYSSSLELGIGDPQSIRRSAMCRDWGVLVSVCIGCRESYDVKLTAWKSHGNNWN